MFPAKLSLHVHVSQLSQLKEASAASLGGWWRGGGFIFHRFSQDFNFSFSASTLFVFIQVFFYIFDHEIVVFAYLRFLS